MKTRCWLFHPKDKVNSCICPKSNRVQVSAHKHEVVKLWLQCGKTTLVSKRELCRTTGLCIKGDTTYLLSTVHNVLSSCSKLF